MKQLIVVLAALVLPAYSSGVDDDGLMADRDAPLGISATVQEKEISFNRDVRPILARNCFACHGRDESAREGELRLDVRKAALDSGVLSPGEPEKSSLLMRVLSSDEDQRMPPPSTGHSLGEKEKQLLRSWIQQGAPYQKHWAFEVPRKSALPPVKNRDWPRGSIDRFILQRLEQEGLMPAEDADRLVWLRRVSLDLTGLPPTLETADRFLEDPSADAYAKVVDQLLKSKSFGEHWARVWLDLARYADTRGYEKDRHRDIWRYRDWVIDALNSDMPYDQFTLEQLAGDLLPDRTSDQVLATAFHRNTMTNEEGGTDNEEFRVAAVKDRVDTTIQVWMGLTMGCAKCHTHKYDPISLSDYYSFYAFFNQTLDNDTEDPLFLTPTAEQKRRIDDLKKRLKNLENLATGPDWDKQFGEWKRQLEKQPLWSPLKLTSSESRQKVRLTQKPGGEILAEGNRPDKDTWTLEFELAPNRKYTALRIDHLPRSVGGGNWPDANVALQEISAELTDETGDVRELKLLRPRASFSQRGWDVRQAIDGDLRVGWAISPRFAEQQAALFEFAKPVSGGKLRIRLVQEYGQGLLLARSRFSVSTHRSDWITPEVQPDLKELFLSRVFPPTREKYSLREKLKSELANLEKSLPRTPVMLERDSGKRRVTRIHSRGNFLEPADTVQPAVLTGFGPLPDGAQPDRSGVARWLLSPENPLTARVMVNRIWARIFGIGLVETEEDFGTQGLPPSHPELLDWLAVDFREQGWSLKRLIRQMVLSRTYRQASGISPDLSRADPRNRLLGRGPRFRLSAEMIRDQALAASGLLTKKIGGPSVMPPQPGGIWKSTYSGLQWKNATGPDRYRRGLYTYLKRTSPYPAMQTFDAGSGEVCQVRRIRTNTPLQALVGLNDPAFFEAAGALAVRMDQSSGELKSKLVNGFRSVLIRHPEQYEIERLEKLYHSLKDAIENEQELLQSAGVPDGNARLVVIANVLLNLDETLSKP